MNAPRSSTSPCTPPPSNLFRFSVNVFSSSFIVAAAVVLTFMLVLRVTRIGPYGLLLLGGAVSVLFTKIASRFILPTVRTLLAQRRLQFSLRTLLIAFAVFGIVFASLTPWLNRRRAQHRIVMSVYAHGGKVCFDRGVPVWLPEKLRTYAYRALRNVDFVLLDDATVRDSTLRELRGLSFDGLSFNCCATLNDTHLVHLQDFRSLKQLYLQNTAITDNGLRHVSKLTQLQVLDLWGTPTNDAGVAQLKKLTALEGLTLNKTLITDQALRDLSQMKSLTSLSLGDTSLTDDILPRLKRMPHLRFLDLFRTGVTVAGVDELRKTLPHAAIIYPQGKIMAAKSSAEDSW